MRIATFNIFWLGTPRLARLTRRPEDEAALVAVLRALDADVLAFQEIVDMELLEDLLARASEGTPRRPTLRDADGAYLTTGRMRRRRSHLQKIALAYDATALELVELPSPAPRHGLHAYPGPRRPLLARFRHRHSGLHFTVANVHLKSGDPAEPADAPPALVRAAECRAVAAWLASHADDTAVLLGDFNAPPEHPSLAPLTTMLPGWTRPEPSYPPPSLSPDGSDERWTSFPRRSILDHVYLSPEAARRLLAPPTVCAFDLDPAFAALRLREATDNWAEPFRDNERLLIENLYRVSDHRPIVVALDERGA